MPTKRVKGGYAKPRKTGKSGKKTAAAQASKNRRKTRAGYNKL